MFISYAYEPESDAHGRVVRDLWLFLRSHGIDARLDLAAAGERQDWALWMAHQIRRADRILVIASPAYRVRAQGQSEPGVGRGVQWEARLIRDAFYRAGDGGLNRFVPVVVPGQTIDGIPDFLAPDATSVYHVEDFTVAGAESLLRLLTDQPAVVEPPLGRPPVLPPFSPSGYEHPVGVAELITEKTEAFVGRDNVFQAISEFIARAPSGYLTIVGDPGAGKTTILAEYVRRTGCVAHFNIRGQSLNTSTFFIHSFGKHLAARYGLARGTRNADPERYGEVISRLLAEARSSLAAEEPLVLVVDALDEVNTADDPAGVNVLFLPRHLPTGVHFVLSSRRADLPLRTDTENRVFDLGAHQADTLDDVRDYLRRMAGRPEVGTWLSDRRIPLSTFVEVLTDKSAGNFMYLRHVLPELVDGNYQDLDIQRLPQGLEQYYESHWRLMGMTALPSPRLKVWVIYLLCEFARPVSPGVLARVLREVEPGADAIAAQQVLQEWRQFLHRDETSDGPKFSLYHASFQDFLHRKDTIASAGLVLRDVNGVIADVLWNHEYGDDGAEPA